MSDSF